MPLPQGGQAPQRSPILRVSFYLRIHLLMQNDQIRHGNTWGKSCFSEVSHAIAFGQVRRAVCHRQLSFLLHCALSCAVYYNCPCLFVCLFVVPPYKPAITLRAKLSGAVYCYRSCSCGFATGERAGGVCYHDNSKLRASVFAKVDQTWSVG